MGAQPLLWPTLRLAPAVRYWLGIMVLEAMLIDGDQVEQTLWPPTILVGMNDETIVKTQTKSDLPACTIGCE